jgi:alpha-D-ribose 1-methylphosphonate 5-triphosphate synthase subunit PhnH
MREAERMDNGGHRNQKNYRSLLQAMSRPGRVFRLEALSAVSPFAAAIAVAESLLDPEVSLCVIGDGGAQALQAALVGATQVRTESLESADFVFICGVQSQGGVPLVKRGRLEFPEEGATLVYCMDSGPAGASGRFRIRLTGPGIAGQGGIAPEMRGVPAEEFQELMAANADYPLGVDAFFVRPNGELMALPRSTRIHVR